MSRIGSLLVTSVDPLSGHRCEYRVGVPTSVWSGDFETSRVLPTVASSFILIQCTHGDGWLRMRWPQDLAPAAPPALPLSIGGEGLAVAHCLMRSSGCSSRCSPSRALSGLGTLPSCCEILLCISIVRHCPNLLALSGVRGLSRRSLPDHATHQGHV